ncbi:MAG: MBL fold metallo-hydrolase [Actinomycetota bacterium]|nr:MBL fold metallo-hydrolase [Actinomycetota bacterium]
MPDSLTFIGTATTILRVGSFTLLTDPNFLRRGQRAYLGRGLWSRRRTEPAMRVSDLPELDAVVLSHLHGDHWDRVARKELDRSPPVVTTPHGARRLERYGFRTYALENWENHTIGKTGEELRMTSMPGVHARGVLGRILPPVMGTMLEHVLNGRVRQRIYLSGDTLTGDHLDAVHERYPQIDAAVIHLGGTRVLGRTVTMDGRQGIDFLRRIQPGAAVPVHYDDYGVFRSPLSDFLDRARDSGLGASLRTVRRGDTVTLN